MNSNAINNKVREHGVQDKEMMTLVADIFNRLQHKITRGYLIQSRVQVRFKKCKVTNQSEDDQTLV
jgi:hypothetical protein